MKKTNLNLLAILSLAVVFFTACNSSEESVPNNETNQVPSEIASKLEAAYFDSSSAKITTFMGEQGVAVEDMFFTFEQIDELNEGSNIPNTEHYRTTNLVKGLPRVITVSVSPDLGNLGSQAIDVSINMLNNLGSQLTYQRVPFGGKGKKKADIEVTEFYELESGGFITLGRAAGFPTRKGDPAKGFGINSRWFELSIAPTVNELAGTMSHEIGHCIGFRHTDYRTRESCGQNINEGSAGVGAIYIDGTPTGSDPTSIMQSCGPADTFNNNDKFAMLAIY
ncbi:M57 family metalloprotease [Tenacibaculum tangerinum]|uniref:M57 family metalloprotease n=1 Tax=Tenacibaculum tangerinum TaxID=3038772 RepID=A0ABY8L5K5_9FLAO|nr:M57 family metalloprotease [Tenacibaculum tangerinum]WGH76566.1 M57 family metalloprotease [Tenacibaculum tangerinum]